MKPGNGFETDLLRTENAQLREALKRSRVALQGEQARASAVTQFLCAVLHGRDVKSLRITPDELESCRLYCFFRLLVSFEDRDDGKQDAVLTLHPLTEQEREQMKKPDDRAGGEQAGGRIIMP